MIMNKIYPLPRILHFSTSTPFIPPCRTATVCTHFLARYFPLPGLVLWAQYPTFQTQFLTPSSDWELFTFKSIRTWNYSHTQSYIVRRRWVLITPFRMPIGMPCGVVGSCRGSDNLEKMYWPTFWMKVSFCVHTVASPEARAERIVIPVWPKSYVFCIHTWYIRPLAWCLRISTKCAFNHISTSLRGL